MLYSLFRRSTLRFKVQKFKVLDFKFEIAEYWLQIADY